MKTSHWLPRFSTVNHLQIILAFHHIPVCFPREEGSSCLCDHTESLLAGCTEVTAVSFLSKEGASRPSVIASDLPTLTLPAFLLKLARHVHFRQTNRQCRGAKPPEFRAGFCQDLPPPLSAKAPAPLCSLPHCVCLEAWKPERARHGIECLAQTVDR